MRITTNPATRLTTAVESYFADLRRIHATGGETRGAHGKNTQGIIESMPRVSFPRATGGATAGSSPTRATSRRYFAH